MGKREKRGSEAQAADDLAGEEAEEIPAPRKRRKQAVCEDASGEEDDDAGLQAAIARHKKMLSKDGSENAAAKDRTSSSSAKPWKKGSQAPEAPVSAAATAGDSSGVAPATKPEKAGKPKKAKPPPSEAKLAELAKRKHENGKLKEKGKLTKKEKYKAAKAAKKEEALKRAGKSSIPCEALEQAALAAAGMERLDPKALDCFLTGLPYMATERHVEEHFAKVGPCTVSLMRDKDSAKITGKGFVTFPSAEMALKAATFSGTKLQNRWINVRLCEVRDSGRNRPNLGPGEKPEGCLGAVVMCDKSITEASLWKFFEDCEVSGVSRMMDKNTGDFRGMAFLDFEDTKKVDIAVAKNGSTLKGRPVFVRFKTDRPGSGGEAGSKGERPATVPEARPGQVAAHNRAPPVPKPCGKATKLDDSDSDDDE